MTLTSKVALVTGAGTGIGRAVAQELASHGAFVACVGRREELCRETVDLLQKSGGSGTAIAMDVRDPASVTAGIAALTSASRPIHIVVNDAGVGGPNDIHAGDDRWHEIVDTNLTGTYLVSKHALPHVPDHGGGRIINVSSVLGRFGVPGYTAYCASKHGVIGFTRALALELGARGITVNAVCPGWVDTDMARVGMDAGARATGMTFDEFKKNAMAAVPIGRMLDPAEVAALVAYLASDAAAGWTGQCLDINGGAFMG